jgi:hypothetical protein
VPSAGMYGSAAESRCALPDVKFGRIHVRNINAINSSLSPTLGRCLAGLLTAPTAENRFTKGRAFLAWPASCSTMGCRALATLPPISPNGLVQRRMTSCKRTDLPKPSGHDYPGPREDRLNVVRQPGTDDDAERRRATIGGLRPAAPASGIVRLESSRYGLRSDLLLGIEHGFELRSAPSRPDITTLPTRTAA